MAKLTETVLYYNPGRPETMKHVAMMKSVLVRMGIRIRNIGPEQVLETVGYLAGMDGFQVLDKAPEGQEDAGLPVIPVEMMEGRTNGMMISLMIFRFFTFSILAASIRALGIPRMDWRRRKIPSTSASWGRATPHILSLRPILEIIR